MYFLAYRNYWIVIGAVDGDGDGVIVSCVVVIGDANGVGESECFSSGELIEGF